MERKIALKDLVTNTLKREGIELHAMMQENIPTDCMISLLDVDDKYMIFVLQVTENRIKMKTEMPFKCQTAATYLVNQYVTGFTFRNPYPWAEFIFDQNTGRMYVRCEVDMCADNYDSNKVAEKLQDLLAVSKYVHTPLQELSRGVVNPEEIIFYVACLQSALDLLYGKRSDKITYGLNALDIEIDETEKEEVEG